MGISAVCDFVLGRPGTVFLTLAITLSSLLVPSEMRARVIIPIGIGILIHTTISWLRDRSSTRRMSQQHGRVLNRLLQLLSDLGDLTHQDHGLWRIEIYVKTTAFAISLRRPFLWRRRLVPTLSFALKHVAPPSPSISLDHELFGTCFRSGRACLWWNTSLADFSARANTTPNKSLDLNADVNRELERRFGSVSVNPIVDQVGKRCLGLLILHTPHDSTVVTKVVGALREEIARRYLARACQDLHDQLVGN